MVELTLSRNILHKIIVEDVTFKKALKDGFDSGEDASTIKSVSALVGCELRHHLLFTYLLKKFSDDFSEENLEYCYLALANKFFLRSLDDKAVKTFLDKQLGDVNHEEFDKIYDYEGSPIDLVNIPRDSVDFTSIRFNTPRWLVKMWQKHFGKGQTFKILKKNIRPTNQYIRANTLKITAEDLLKKYPNDLEATSEQNLLLVKSGKNAHKFEDYKLNNFFFLNKNLSEIASEFDNDLLDEITLYSGEDNAFFHELLVRSNLQKGINLVVPDIETRPEILRLIRLTKARNVNLFSANDEIKMKTGISHPQEIFYVFPKSSSFDKISTYPDYLFHFKRESLDEIIAGEKNALAISAPYVMKDGLLIYMVDTLNKKESSNLIAEFINEHSDFELIKEEQKFPSIEGDSALYYAVLKRK